MKYEYKKLFSSKLMIVMLLLTLGYMIFLPLREVGGNVSELRKRYAAYETVISQARQSGKTYGELYDELNVIFSAENDSAKPVYSDDVFLDAASITRAAEKLQYVSTGFEADRKNLIKGMICRNVTENQKTSPDRYLIRANEKAISLYNRKIALEFESTGINSGTHYSLFNFSRWEYVMLALCVLMTVRLFTLEYTTGARRLVNTSRRTEQSLFIKKHITVISIAALVLLLHAIFEAGFGMYVFGTKNFSLPIQQIEDFEYCPYAISIAEFYVIKYIVRLISYIAVISVTALISVWIKRPLIVNTLSLIITAGGLLSNMALYGAIDKAEKHKAELIPIYDRLRMLLPQSLLNIREYLISFDNFSLFGFPCSRIGFCILFTVVISVACMVLGHILSGRIRRA